MRLPNQGNNKPECHLTLVEVYGIVGLTLVAVFVFPILLQAREITPEHTISLTPQAYLPLVQAPRPTATPTLRPHFGVKLNYAVTIESPQRVRVLLTARDVDASTLSLYRTLMYDPATLPPISAISVSDPSGRLLPYVVQLLGFGTARPAQELTITTGGARELRIDYVLNLSSQLYWFADASAIGLPETSLFFQPRSDRLAIGEMRFQFTIPPQWRLVSRFMPSQSDYLANLDDILRMPTESGWWSFVLSGPIAFGDFAVIETRFGNVRALAAYPRQDASYQADASYVARIYAYAETMLGHQGRDVGDLAFVYVFVPWQSQNGQIDTICTRSTFESAHAAEDRHLGHEMFHQWIGDGCARPDAWRFLWSDLAFSEGLMEFLGVESHLTTDAMTSTTADAWRVGFYQQYKSVLLDGGNDVALTECQSLGFRADAWYACLYAKSFSVIWLLDQTLIRASGGTADVELWLKNLFATYAADPDNRPSLAVMENEATRISGHNFGPFFSAYVSGSRPLPIYVEDGQLKVNWSLVPVNPSSASSGRAILSQ